MSKLIEIQKQIEELQLEAAKLKSAGRADALVKIKDMMAAYGITIADIKQPKRASKNSKVKSDKSDNKPVKRASSRLGKPVPIKYKGPNGEAWTGRGITPKWMVALEAQGRNRSEFSV